MPRKSLVDVLNERLGGVWLYTPEDRSWHSGDRYVTRRIKCNCWAWTDDSGVTKCRCPIEYVLHSPDPSEDGKVLDLADPRVYRRNGRSTQPNRHKT